MREEAIRVERVPDVLILRLSRGVTNALDLDLVTRITQVLEDVKRDPTIRHLVLAGANDKFFSIGFDIPQLIELPRGELGTFYGLFNQMCIGLYTLPKPTAARADGSRSGWRVRTCSLLRLPFHD